MIDKRKQGAKKDETKIETSRKKNGVEIEIDLEVF